MSLCKETKSSLPFFIHTRGCDNDDDNDGDHGGSDGVRDGDHVSDVDNDDMP